MSQPPPFFASAVPIPRDPDDDSDHSSLDRPPTVDEGLQDRHEGPPGANDEEHNDLMQHLIRLVAHEAAKAGLEDPSNQFPSLAQKLQDAHLPGLDPTLVPTSKAFRQLLAKPSSAAAFLLLTLEDLLPADEYLQAQELLTSKNTKDTTSKSHKLRMPNRLALLGQVLCRWTAAGFMVSGVPQGLLLSHSAAVMKCADLYGTAAAISYHRKQTLTASAELSMGKSATDITIKEFNNLVAFE
ncbi:hypothetical protein FOZ63_004777, partial [Perkinsus olseni]